MLARLNMETALRQLLWLCAGSVVLFIVVMVLKRVRDFGLLNYVMMAAALGLIAVAYLFADTIGGARNWVTIAGVPFQPSEISKVFFIIVSAYFFAERRAAAPPSAMLCSARFVYYPCAVQRSRGRAAFCRHFLIMFFAERDARCSRLRGSAWHRLARWRYHIFSYVRVRVEIWQNPWIYHRTQGYQIVQGLMAIAAGGLFGSGLGLGYPSSIPVNTSDFIYAVICEEFGLIFGMVIILSYLVFIIRGMIIAMNAGTRFDALLVFGATCMLSLQSFIIIGGVIKMIPLTGITLPFISAGGTSMISSLALVGIIEGVAVKNGERDEREIKSAGGEVL